ncbi:DUF4314 domain-containing protein [bacterium]|nr:DUF4314 domain-containing protein [bacterium]
MSQWIVDLLKPGDRIQLLSMPNDPNPIPVGTLGTVVMVTPLHFKEKETQVLVKWDNGRNLSCICPPDVFSLVPAEEPVGGTVVSPVV